MRLLWLIFVSNNHLCILPLYLHMTQGGIMPNLCWKTWQDLPAGIQETWGCKCIFNGLPTFQGTFQVWPFHQCFTFFSLIENCSELPTIPLGLLMDLSSFADVLGSGLQHWFLIGISRSWEFQDSGISGELAKERHQCQNEAVRCSCWVWTEIWAGFLCFAK